MPWSLIFVTCGFSNTVVSLSAWNMGQSRVCSYVALIPYQGAIVQPSFSARKKRNIRYVPWLTKQNYKILLALLSSKVLFTIFDRETYIVLLPQDFLYVHHSMFFRTFSLSFRVKFSRLEYSPAMKSANELDAPISSKHFFASNSVLSKQNVHFLCWNQLNVSKYTRLS